MLIGGERASRDERIAVTNPADSAETVGWVPRGTADDVRRATSAAANAFQTWSRVSMAERAGVLRAAARELLIDADARAELLTRESGQILSEAQRGIRGCSRTLEYYADLGDSFDPVETLPSPNGRVFVVREPMGVAAVIVPWNAPTFLAFFSLAPILLAGNTAVIKPPSDAPLALIDMIRVMQPLFPPGTLNVVTGPGAETGTALATDPLVRKINFTGSSETGKEIVRAAAGTVKRVSLELGGNDPAVVLGDADLDHAVPELVRGVFANSGQICYDVKRIYVHEALYGAFVDRFTEAADQLTVGNGLDPRATMGPLINRSQLERVNGLVASAMARGATAVTVGRQLDAAGWKRGNFMLPTIVTDVDQDASVVRCEQFGPVIPILPFTTEDEGVALANDSEFGLAASVWTADEEHGLEVARRVQAGTTFVNIHRPGASGVDMPFGGMKESGLGRSHAAIALEEQLEWHTISSRRP